MRAVVVLGTRFDRTGDGHIWSQVAWEYAFWQRYLDVFDEIRIVVRVRDTLQAGPQASRVDGRRVSFVPLPYYVGPWQYLRRYFALRSAIRAIAQASDAVILRVPSPVANLLAGMLEARCQPYALEVIADPHSVFGPGAVRTLGRPFLRWRCARSLRRQCARAAAVAYVTDHVLQQGYPPAPQAYAIACSDIDLPEEAFARGLRLPQPEQRAYRLLLVGTLEQLYKGPDVLLQALAVNVARGLDHHLTILGEGRHRPELEELARTLGVSPRVRFAGVRPAGDPVRAELDRADLFVLPSRAEGQSRALIEAMARGLPCVASAVGGMLELLAPEDLVPPGSVDALAAKIREVLSSHQRLAQMAARNLMRARDFHADILRARRRAFYEVIRDHTQEWQRRQATKWSRA
jgi:glycosyltransferase involved in cell wall biosynthesis